MQQYQNIQLIVAIIDSKGSCHDSAEHKKALHTVSQNYCYFRIRKKKKVQKWHRHDSQPRNKHKMAAALAERRGHGNLKAWHTVSQLVDHRCEVEEHFSKHFHPRPLLSPATCSHSKPKGKSPLPCCLHKSWQQLSQWRAERTADRCLTVSLCSPPYLYPSVVLNLDWKLFGAQTSFLFRVYRT